MRPLLLAALLTTFSLNALSAERTQHTYLCEDGLLIDATYNATEVTLSWGEEKAQKITLPQRPSGSGALYIDATQSWHTKGRAAILARTTPEAPHLICEEIDTAAPAPIFKDPTIGISFSYPPGWDKDSVQVITWHGANAAMREPNALHYFGFDYVPKEATEPRALLGRIAALPRKVWESHTQKDKDDIGQLLDQTTEEVFVFIPPQISPYNPDSLDAYRFRNLQIPFEQWKARFCLDTSSCKATPAH